MATYSITDEGPEEALAAAATETLLQLRGVTTAKGELAAWSTSFKGVSATEAPILVRLCRYSTDGTATGATEVLLDTDDGAALITGFHSFTAEPTISEVIEIYEVHPQGGMILREYPPGRGPKIAKVTTSRIGISVTTPSGVTATAVAFMQWDE